MIVSEISLGQVVFTKVSGMRRRVVVVGDNGGRGRRFQLATMGGDVLPARRSGSGLHRARIDGKSEVRSRETFRAGLRFSSLWTANRRYQVTRGILRSLHDLESVQQYLTRLECIENWTRDL